MKPIAAKDEDSSLTPTITVAWLMCNLKLSKLLKFNKNCIGLNLTIRVKESKVIIDTFS